MNEPTKLADTIELTRIEALGDQIIGDAFSRAFDQMRRDIPF